mmetsp:Transcript_100275/g.174019  ORF Transcript_100275/g.174019 Transcript_100275/m.174019 type:complete len:110 (-) Transcript_100275:61-390(-)
MPGIKADVLAVKSHDDPPAPATISKLDCRVRTILETQTSASHEFDKNAVERWLQLNEEHWIRRIPTPEPATSDDGCTPPASSRAGAMNSFPVRPAWKELAAPSMSTHKS